jgi:hypothetical protein
MHFMPDTEDADSAAETFWPEGYKQVIREELRQLIGAQLNGGGRLRHVYQQQYSEKYRDLNQFVSRIADMLVIGAENGADDAFDDIISAFLTESPLPEVRKYARYFWPQVFPQSVKERLRQVIVDEYSQDNIYIHAYKVGYQGSYRNFGEFISQVARLVVTGATNGTDDTLEAIYRSFVTPYPLPPARRHPRRLKVW